MYNGVIRALQRLGLADIYGRNSQVPIYVLNVTYPLIPSRISGILPLARDHVLVVEEGQPEFIEQTQLGVVPVPRRNGR